MVKLLLLQLLNRKKKPNLQSFVSSVIVPMQASLTLCYRCVLQSYLFIVRRKYVTPSTSYDGSASIQLLRSKDGPVAPRSANVVVT
jgi:hypothetical protein